MSSANIAYAPPLLPDELLYSWLARLAALNAMSTPRDVLEQFFGCRTLVPSVDLPSRLLAAAERLGGLLPFATLDGLLEDGTLLPYHRPFLTESTYTQVRERLLRGDGKGLKTLMGRVANRFGAHPALRSCPICLAESWNRHGCVYWMRQHQLPGVNCCAVHGIELQALALHARTHRQRLELPSLMPETVPPVLADARQRRFAQLSQDLIDAALQVIAPQQRAVIYRDTVLAIGHRTRRGNVDFPGLASALRLRFQDFRGFDHQARLLATDANPLAWLRALIEKPQRSLHPICHLLLIDFLFGSVSAFRTACAACNSQPHPRLLFPSCIKQAAKASDSLPALTIDHEAALRDTSLSCRQVAAIIGRSVTTVVAWRRERNIPIRERRKSLSPAKLDRIRQALGSRSSLSAVAKQAGVSLSSVYRNLALYPPRQLPRPDAHGSSQLPQRRERWMAALLTCQNDGLGRVSDARARASADYAWLYRHDRDWLFSTTSNRTPVARSCLNECVRLDWVQRDDELCQLLLARLAVLRKELPPKRITRSRLIRSLGETMVRRNLKRLPRLCALLDESADSTIAFGMRRVDHAISLLIKDGLHLRVWRIQRLAALRTWSNALTTYANQQIERRHAADSLHSKGIPRRNFCVATDAASTPQR